MARDDDEALAHEREWQRIVENFGERAVLGPEDDGPDAPAASTGRPSYAGSGGADVSDGPDGAGGTRGGDTDPADQVPPDEQFVPPTPPPDPPARRPTGCWRGSVSWVCRRSSSCWSRPA
ncbi:hypothetical protein [Nocardioides sp. TF02-7]|uniref:hypothetical protein n=1 Tax=Nocardioides sp. TF02-7 TaxID=2917724 RepID=UPI001F05A362|nr:hypothetical protein [Nocardioides sp. TF02-7]UMG92066.1 hypothetical protein MF408_19160 [Nocardioides sp. TF02-7]